MKVERPQLIVESQQLETKSGVRVGGLEEEAEGEVFDVGINLVEDDQTDEKTGLRIGIFAEPVEIALRLPFAHEEHDAGAAVERRNGKKIEGPKKEIEGKESEEDDGGDAESACDSVAMKPVKEAAGTQRSGGDKHESEVGGGTGKSHPGGAAGMAAFPEGVERSAGPADHAAGGEGGLATEGGGVVSTEFGSEGVGGFMAGGGKKKDHVGDEAEKKFFGREIIHTRW